MGKHLEYHSAIFDRPQPQDPAVCFNSSPGEEKVWQAAEEEGVMNSLNALSSCKRILIILKVEEL